MFSNSSQKKTKNPDKSLVNPKSRNFASSSKSQNLHARPKNFNPNPNKENLPSS